MVLAQHRILVKTVISLKALDTLEMYGFSFTSTAKLIYYLTQTIYSFDDGCFVGFTGSHYLSTR